MTTVDFVIVNYKCDKDTGRLIHQIGQTFPWSHTITVIDNTLENRGFARATNLGAKFGSGDIIAFLNPDIHLVGGWADETMTALESDARLVICGPRLDDGFPWPRETLSTNGIHNWVCGACYFVRRDFFESCGGFDERYFFSYEETDLIRQAESQGYRVRAVDTEKPLIKHIRSHSEFHNQQLRQSAIKYHEKWG